MLNMPVKYSKYVESCRSSRMYDYGMLREISGSFNGSPPNNAEEAFYRLCEEMRSCGVKGFWPDHLEKVGKYVGIVAAKVSTHSQKKLRIFAPYLKDVVTAAHFHDIGNPLCLVGENGQGGYMELEGRERRTLSPDEKSGILFHPAISCIAIEMIDPDGRLGINKRAVLDTVLFHHRHYDGDGYPDFIGMQGESIPVGARILSLADSIDVAKDPRHPRLNGETVKDTGQLIAEISRESGMQYDPYFSKLFVEELENGSLN